jgi:hypothetical protein
MKFAVKNIDGVQNTTEGKLKYYFTVNDDYDFSGNTATDVTDISLFELFYSYHRVDYKHIRDYAKEMVQTTPFSSMTFDNQTRMTKYRSVDDTTVIGFYMSQGMTLTQAKERVLTEYMAHNFKYVKACDIRWNAAKFVTVGYLSFPDAIHFVRATRDLVEDMLKYGILGTNDGDEDDGIMDYIESTGEWVGMGLAEQGYTTSYGTINDLVADLILVFREGQYDIEKLYLPPNEW